MADTILNGEMTHWNVINDGYFPSFCGTVLKKLHLCSNAIRSYGRQDCILLPRRLVMDGFQSRCAVAQADIRKEADLIERFSSAYRKRLGQLVEQLNKPGFAAADMQCLRLCVEAVDLILSSQSKLARAIDRLSDQSPDALPRLAA
jgi:hypothetical protein